MASWKFSPGDTIRLLPGKHTGHLQDVYEVEKKVYGSKEYGLRYSRTGDLNHYHQFSKDSIETRYEVIMTKKQEAALKKALGVTELSFYAKEHASRFVGGEYNVGQEKIDLSAKGDPQLIALYFLYKEHLLEAQLRNAQNALKANEVEARSLRKECEDLRKERDQTATENKKAREEVARDVKVELFDRMFSSPGICTPFGHVGQGPFAFGRPYRGG